MSLNFLQKIYFKQNYKVQIVGFSGYKKKIIE